MKQERNSRQLVRKRSRLATTAGHLLRAEPPAGAPFRTRNMHAALACAGRARMLFSGQPHQTDCSFSRGD
eukprot:3360020-Pleurochrysis_carterae.AAC.1